jgi:hypothetical protein
MVRDDLVAGLRNALERGTPLEGAKKSLINAGYSSEEVEEASNYLHSGSVLAAHPQQLKKPADSVQPSKPKKTSVQQPKNQQQNKKSGEGFFARNWKIVLLLGILAVLIILFVLVLVFRDKIATWLW